MKKSKQGGKRPGAGRPKSEPTKVLTVRVKEKHYKEVKAAAIAKIKELG